MPKRVLFLLGAAVCLLAASFVKWDGEPGAVPAMGGGVATRTPVEYGRALFAARGCASCHRHDGLSSGQTTAPIYVTRAPDLSRYQPDPIFIRQWLRDPASVRPDTRMPNLNLSDEEIEALLVFFQANSKP
jgi:mono/diheme cytochrome c family protein